MQHGNEAPRLLSQTNLAVTVSTIRDLHQPGPVHTELVEFLTVQKFDQYTPFTRNRLFNCITFCT